MAEYAIYIKDEGNGGLEVHAQLERGIYQKSSKGAQAVEVAKAAIKAWIESGGEDWENIDFTSIASARKVRGA
jgi:hypothetical protein